MPRDGQEIVPETGRRKRAMANATPIPRSPTSKPTPPGESQADARLAILQAIPRVPAPTAQPISPTERKARKRGAVRAPIPRVSAPPASPLGSNADGDGHPELDTQGSAAIAGIVAELVALQRKRRFCIVSQSRIDRSMESLIASVIGFRIDAEEADRKKVFAQAKAIRIDVEKHADPQSDVAADFVPLILTSAGTRQQWDELRADVERRMRKLVRGLPAYDFVASIKGFGDLGFAIICAEAGIPIGEYRTVSGLWKRLGLAVIDGVRQRKMTDKGAAERHGYSPKRRAEVWAQCSDSMFRAQWRGPKDEDGNDANKTKKPVVTPAGPIGPYGEVYAKRRAHTEPRVEATADLPAGDPAKWTKGRCHNDARRIMTKELLKDLWVEWRKSSPA